MEKNLSGSPEAKENGEAEKYLESGLQTLITPAIEKAASSIEQTQQDKVRGIFDFLKTLPYGKINKQADVFRKRTADQIISDGYVEGCADISVVFVSLARAMKIPAKYVETIDISWLKSKKESVINGHSYAEVFDDKNGWVMVDPTKRKINADIKADGRAIFMEGLDSWDIGIRDFDSLKKQFIKFREDWQANP